MSANPTALRIDKPANAHGGIIWHRLHSEREDVCEALLKQSISDAETTAATRMFPESVSLIARCRIELLHARLCKIDSALDRLMSGSYGDCSKCGKWIEDTKLDLDPAMEFCLECWRRMQVGH